MTQETAMGLSIRQVAVGGYDKNFSYLLYDAATHNAAIVDPSGDLDAVLEVVDEQKLDLVGVLITHTHFDHVDKLDALLRSYALPVHVHQQGVSNLVSQSPVFPFKDKETLVLGESQVMVLHTPGHTDDASCFYIDIQNASDGIPKLITGDTLFVEGCGRTTTKSVHILYRSLQKLMRLSSGTEVYPGHDYGSQPHSTIGWEKEHNRFLCAKNYEAFKKLRLG